MFSDAYKTIVICEITDKCQEMIDWINDNSNDDVKVSFVNDTNFSQSNYEKYNAIYIGFKNLNDATYFRIKYNI